MGGSLDIGTGAMIAGAAVPTGRAVRLSVDSLAVSSVTTQRTDEIADRPLLPGSSSEESPGTLSPAMAAATTGATGIVIATMIGMMIVTATKGSKRSIQGPKVRKLVRIAHHVDRLNMLAFDVKLHRRLVAQTVDRPNRRHPIEHREFHLARTAL